MTERARHLVVAAAAVLVGLVLILVATSVAAHPEAERYIPIGKSPGISGKYSYQGPIAMVDEVAGQEERIPAALQVRVEVVAERPGAVVGRRVAARVLRRGAAAGACMQRNPPWNGMLAQPCLL